MIILPVHILAGALALGFGYLALFSKKGAAVHRTTGRYFVYAMVAMSLTGAVLATVKATPPNIVAGLMTFYFVTTGLLTVRTRPTPHWIKLAALFFAIAVALFAFQVGRALAAAGHAEAGGMFLFGAVVMVAAIGDVRVMRAGGIEGPRRLARHLWRMCFPMWVAAISFLVRVPKSLNIPGIVLAIPVLLPLAVMLYWLSRLRRKRGIHALGAMPMSVPT